MAIARIKNPAAVTAMSDAERIERLRAHGHDAFLSTSRAILIRSKDGRRVYRVVGGDFKHPSLLQVKGNEQ